jgi:hypothetical protein
MKKMVVLIIVALALGACERSLHRTKSRQHHFDC